MGTSIYKVATILVLLLVSCQHIYKKTSITEVKYYGALKTMMSGNIQSVISLDSLSNKKNLYALGAMENLKGEIQIFNSKPSNSFVLDSSLQIKNSYNIKAALLVSAEVKEWNTIEISNMTTKNDLENTLFEIAKTNGINTEKPFPFLLEGTLASLDWHVINWKEGDTVHNHKKHKEAGLFGNLRNIPVQILGFYSTKHKTVFTHHSTNMHLHFKTNDHEIAGHVDDLQLGNKMILKLPKQ
ncbi:MAG: acetolactate decarboxylase [Paraglaciecola sp.]|jgi:acetolactate decarboxylase|uniref:acetolactate decarboxylase n=1 Tax=Polaribacter sp. TaxID=1920175 RepID=UPI003ACAD85D